MKIKDITYLLPSDNYHCFNPSIVHLKNNLYLMSFRHIPKVEQKYQHPWDLWNGNYRSRFHSIIHKKDDVPCASSAHLMASSSSCGKINSEPDLFAKKFENILLEAFPLQSEHHIETGRFEDISCHDGTGFVLLAERESFFDVVHVFPNSQNMIDARLSKDNYGRLWIVYNVSFWIWLSASRTKKFLHHMRYRQVSIENDFQTLVLDNEQNLLQNVNYRFDEKNCQIHFPSKILYHISPCFHTIDFDGTPTLTQNKIYEYILSQEGSYVHMSLSTPPIPFTLTTNIAVGHFKVVVLELLQDGRQTPLRRLYTTFVENHPNKYLYMYFMYIFEYHTTSMDIVRISPAFLVCSETNVFFPYPVVFPMSLLKKNDEYHIFYGDGDTMCKILLFREKEFETMLLPPLSYKNHYPFILLQTNE